MSDLSSHRREYGSKTLSADNLPKDPKDLLKSWMDEAIKSQCVDPTSFVLATCHDWPDARVVLLKDITDTGITFFTNYDSTKARDMALNPKVAACFYWRELSRQVRIKGKASKISHQISQQYFDSRPRLSQVAAIISPQSKTIPSRAWLEDKFKDMEDKTLACPDNWGGYVIEPISYEFFQGRDNRLHDRFHAQQDDNNIWKWARLAP